MVEEEWGHSPYSRDASHQDFKILNDPIHGHIKIDSVCVDVIDTPQFQRLRDLKQLGACYYVFPGASHNRAEHCIGTCHLAGQMIERFQTSQPELEITDREVELVKVAGLCHDLGHGPYSHVFDGEFMKRARPEMNWKHEQGSVEMFDHLVDENGLDFDTSEMKVIKGMILRNDDSMIPSDRRFMFDIISNTRNSVDVDKFDYLARDCHNLGMKSSYDFSRLMLASRVIDDEICFHMKEVYNLYEMFHTRYSLHKQVYSHRVSKAIEYMIMDALLSANAHLKISQMVDDPVEYCGLTDCILKSIEVSKDQELEEARKIIHRIRTRDLYKFVDEVLIPPEMRARFPSVTEEDISTSQGFAGILKPGDLIVQNMRMNYAMKSRNPVNHCHFFGSWTADISFPIRKERVSALIPDNFEERYVRVFVRDPRKKAAAHRAFFNFIHKNGLIDQDGFSSSSDESNPASKRSKFMD